MDTRRRISFNMNTGGGQPSEPSTGGTYTVNLNNAWQLSTTIINPDSTLYDGVYQSYANKGVHNSGDIMYIDIEGLESFKLYIRSYAESSWDYIMVSQLDKTLTYNSSYSDTSLVKAHTRGNQNSGTSINNYTLVEFTGIDGGKHRISIIYRKDSSSNSGDDRGYVLIPKSNGSSGGGGGTPDNPGTGGDTSGSINTDNYLTILALENGLTASLSTNACQYCIDGDGNWKNLTAGTSTQAINSGQTLSFRGNLTPNSSKGIGTFTISKKCNIEGNCMSMLFGDNVVNNNSLSGKNYAFYKLFYNCKTIIQVSGTFLPATTLAESCYRYMFYGCSKLTTAPELPATTLASYCYDSMFRGCTSLTQTPELPATTLDSSCYSYMFYGCSSLITAPELPATTLANDCYQYMFYGCSSLKVAPALPATTLTSGCYYTMFYGCSSLTTAPELPATTLASNCYESMFQGCSSLTTTPELPATTLAGNCYYKMFQGCSKLTTAPELPATKLADGCYSSMFSGTNVLPDCSNIDFTSSTVVSSGGLRGLFAGTKVTDNDLYNILPINSATRKYWLPATKLASYCYQFMFQNCTSLTTAPELPATTLDSHCYYYMFCGCSSLITAPELPATKLTSNCYNGMFHGCKGLTTAPELPATTLSTECYSSMFYRCTSLTQTPELPATTLDSSCYSYMFYGCSSLTTAPSILPATTLASNCYESMFFSCRKLNYIKMLATDISASGCLGSWVYGVSSTGTFVKNPDMTSLPTGSSGIPSGWTVYNDGEEPRV